MLVRHVLSQLSYAPELADNIGADFYGKDAMASVRYATELAERLS